MEMTTYAKYRILLFSLELTDGKFVRVNNLEDGCSAIEAKAVFDEMRRAADVVDVGEGAGHRLSLVQEIDSLLAAFAEATKPSSNLYICDGKWPLFNGAIPAQEMISAIHRTFGRFFPGHLANLLVGQASDV